MEEDCWLSILDYVEASEKLHKARHLCRDHDNPIECRNARDLDLKLSDAHLKVLNACEASE